MHAQANFSNPLLLFFSDAMEIDSDLFLDPRGKNTEIIRDKYILLK